MCVTGNFWVALGLGLAIQSHAAVDGMVVEAGTGVPLANVDINYVDGVMSTRSDAQGHFHLPSASEGIRGRESVIALAARRADAAVSFDVLGKRWRTDVPRFLFEDFPRPKTGHNSALEKTEAGTPCALALDLTGYHPLETNCIDGGSNTVELTPEASTHYNYHIPVQLEDGLTTGDIKDVFPNTKPLLNGMDSLAAKKFKEVHSLLIIKGGKLVLEQYYRGSADTIDFEHGVKRIKVGDIQWSRTDKHYLASCNKAITSIIVGLAMNKAGLPVSTPLAQLLPKYQSQLTGTKATITVEHALTMTMGFQWDEWTGTNLADMWATQDIIAYVFGKNVATTPGTVWIYNSGGPNILLGAMATAIGGDVAQFAKDSLFTPLGIQDYKWEKQPNGMPEGSARMFMRPRDMAKLGQMYLKGGAWQGKQIVPVSWVTASTKFQKTARPKNPNDYGYLWWIRKLTTPQNLAVNYFEAEGDGGNYIAVLPAQDMVVVFTGGNYFDSYTYDSQIVKLLGAFIIPSTTP